METPPVGYSSPRDVLTVTTPKVIENLDRSSSTAIGEVYTLSEISWTDTDGTVNDKNPEVKSLIENYLKNQPKAKFFVALEIATRVSDTLSTWGAFSPKISPSLNKTTIDWLTEGVLNDDEETLNLDVALIANMVSGRIAVEDSFLTKDDLQNLVVNIESKVSKVAEKNESVQESWKKITNDLNVAETMSV